MEQRRKMAFYEVARGNLAKDFQKVFEKAQEIAEEMKQPVSCTLTMKINPADEEGFGSLSYTVKHTQPTKQSRTFDTLIENGKITKDAQDPTDLFQLELALETPENAHQFRTTGTGENS